MLEIACMKDEPLPEKRVNHAAGSAPGGQAPPALMVSTTGVSDPHQQMAGGVLEDAS